MRYLNGYLTYSSHFKIRKHLIPKITSNIKPLTIEGIQYHHHKLYVYEGSSLYSVLSEYERKGKNGVSLEIGLLNNLIIKLNKHYSLSLNLNYFRYTDVNVGITIEEHPTSTENHTFKVFDGVVDCNKRTYDDLKELLIRIETMLAVLDIDTIKKVLIE